MRNKALFLATTAVALITGTGQANAGDLYISVFGGLNMLADSSGVAELDTSSGDRTEYEAWSSDADTGFVLGGAIGTHLDRWARGLRAEVEVSYRRNDLGGRFLETSGTGPSSSSSVTEEGFITGNLSTFAVMANVWYEFDMGSKFRPYIGGGAGWARMHGDMVAVSTDGSGVATDTDTSTSTHVSGFAWQLGLGVNYEVSPGVDLGLGYRYFKGPKFEPFFEEENALENANHTVQVNLTVDID